MTVSTIVLSQPRITPQVRLLQRVLNAVQTFAALVLLGAILLVFAGVAPTFLGGESFTVYSGSMEPAIPVGSLAVVMPTPGRDLVPGHIITYRTPAQPNVVVTHRLIGIEQGENNRLQYRTKGDANLVEDLVLVDPNAVLGRVIYHVPVAGFIVDFSKRNEGRLLFIAMPALLLVVDFLRERIRLRSQRATPQQLAAAAQQGDPVAEQDRIRALLERGQRALEAGYAELANKAADGALAADPRNVEAWLLKANAAPDPEARAVRLQAGLMVNPNADRLSAALEDLRRGGVRAPA